MYYIEPSRQDPDTELPQVHQTIGKTKCSPPPPDGITIKLILHGFVVICHADTETLPTYATAH